MSDRLKVFVYIRVKDDTRQTDWILGDDTPSGTIAVAVPEFSEDWKKAADDRYAQEFGLSLTDMDWFFRNAEAQRNPEGHIPEALEAEYESMKTAREMLLEQDYQFAALIEFNGTEGLSFDRIVILENALPADSSVWTEGVRFLDMFETPGPSLEHGTWIKREWEGSFRIINAERSAKERVEEAVAHGKTVLCAIPMPLGARYLVLGPDGQFAGGYETSSNGVKECDVKEVGKLLVDIQERLSAWGATL